MAEIFKDEDELNRRYNTYQRGYMAERNYVQQTLRNPPDSLRRKLAIYIDNSKMNYVLAEIANWFENETRHS